MDKLWTTTQVALKQELIFQKKQLSPQFDASIGTTIIYILPKYNIGLIHLSDTKVTTTYGGKLYHLFDVFRNLQMVNIE